MAKKLPPKSPSTENTNAKTESQRLVEKRVKITIYLPPYYGFLLDLMASFSDERRSDMIRRLLLPAIDKAMTDMYEGSAVMLEVLSEEGTPEDWRKWAKNYFLTLAKRSVQKKESIIRPKKTPPSH